MDLGALLPFIFLRHTTSNYRALALHSLLALLLSDLLRVLLFPPPNQSDSPFYRRRFLRDFLPFFSLIQVTRSNLF